MRGFPTKQFFGLLLPVALLTQLSACSNDMNALKAEIQSVKDQPPGEIEPIPEIKTYTAFEYPGYNRDPFDPDIMAAAISPRPLAAAAWI